MCIWFRFRSVFSFQSSSVPSQVTLSVSFFNMDVFSTTTDGVLFQAPEPTRPYLLTLWVKPSTDLSETDLVVDCAVFGASFPLQNIVKACLSIVDTLIQGLV